METNMEWIPTAERLPEKPGLAPYEYIDCLILIDGNIKFRPWNCEHQCWDDEAYDDFAYEAHEPSHWLPLPTPPKE